ncbi:MAG TPA: hypothetical protein VMT71_02060 [Syntrophorhabdales bacterium]|nr:hypothetical protein [Syntrophorhabdales bacterium]
MKYLIPIIIIILLVRYLIKKNKNLKAAPMSKPQSEVLKQDPICGAYVAQRQELSLRTSEGINYFCSIACMEKFKELKR